MSENIDEHNIKSLTLLLEKYNKLLKDLKDKEYIFQQFCEHFRSELKIPNHIGIQDGIKKLIANKMLKENK